MKRLIALILIIILCPQLALASQVENFRQLVDDYHYAATVEWDQKDAAFLVNENKKFHTVFSELRAQGLTNEEIQQVIPAD